MSSAKAHSTVHNTVAMSLNPTEQELKQQFESLRGVWTDSWAAVVKLDPGYFAAYLKLRAVPAKNQALPVKIQELLLLALDAACTTLFIPGIKAHLEAALAAGASRAEIIEVLQLSSVLGVHAITMGVPILTEVLEEEGKTLNIPMDARREALKADFQEKRGFWDPIWQAVVEIDPDFFEAYTEYSSHPFRKPDGGSLEPMVKELVFCAIDVSTTHLYAPGLKVHVRNAIRYGATPQQILEVYQLAALMGAHTPLAAAELLASVGDANAANP